MKNFLIPEKSKLNWAKPQNMASFQKRGSFRIGASVRNFLIPEKSILNWDYPQNMASFQERGSFRISCEKIPLSGKE